MLVDYTCKVLSPPRCGSDRPRQWLIDSQLLCLLIMGLANWLSCFFGFWASVYLIDAGLRAHAYTRQWYQDFTNRFGISVKLLHARLFTQRFNCFFQYFSQIDFLPWNLWFSVGVVFCTCSMVLSVGLLTLLVYNTLSKKPTNGQFLTPVLPGVNLPPSHFCFYIVALLLSAWLHEAGHALAALRERVRLQGFGIFLLGFYPGAYVNLNTADLQSLSALGQLRIYCAGVWHNAVIASVGVLLLSLLPVLLSPAYLFGSGVGVTYLRENSVVTGVQGLALGDAITHVNSCPITNQSDWYRCLTEIHTNPTGYCVSIPFLNALDLSSTVNMPRVYRGRSLNAVVLPSSRQSSNNDTSINESQSSSEPDSPILAPQQVQLEPTSVDCCGNASTSTHLCFAYSFGTGPKSVKHACLPARAVTERPSCRLASDCSIRNGGGSGGGASPRSSSDPSELATTRSLACAIPSLTDGTSRLVKLTHRRSLLRTEQTPSNPPILFLGPLDDLLGSIGVSDYVSRWPAVFPPNLPTIIAHFCTYLFSFSAAFALMNVVPCYALDGQYILQASFDLFLPRYLIRSSRFRKRLLHLLTIMGTALLMINIFLAFFFYFVVPNYHVNLSWEWPVGSS